MNFGRIKIPHPWGICVVRCCIKKVADKIEDKYLYTIHLAVRV
jgi:hypothetical protein